MSSSAYRRDRSRSRTDVRRQERIRAYNQAFSPTRRRQSTRVMMARRTGSVLIFIAILMCALVGRLAWVQLYWGPDLAAKAAEQRSRMYVEPARRGAILDQAGNQLAYTMQARSLTVSPIQLRKELREQQELQLTAEQRAMPSADLDAFVQDKVDEVLKDMARRIPRMIADSGASSDKVSEREISTKLAAQSSYEVLVRNVDPDVAHDIAAEFHGVAADHQDIRQYPNGAIAENILGKVSMDGQGQFGMEAWGDDFLAGANGQSVEEVAASGEIIPGTLRELKPTVPGSDITLTLDVELQTYVQQAIESAKKNSLAKHAEAVVLDAKTGHILAMANSDTINPNGNIEDQLGQEKSFDNSSTTHPYEPGSVAKVITAAGTINDGLTTPDEVHTVPGSIDMAGVTVNDAWEHGPTSFTTTGIFGKSSNVGTLMLAQRLGEDRFDYYLDQFGIGQLTGVELPAESAGLRPDLADWGGGTFANLPIGQGMSLTTLQLASVYQALANGGERIEPRLISFYTNADGEVIHPEPGKKTQVVSPQAAATVLNMFRATMQEDPSGGNQYGTAAGNGVAGYQTAGKTGTAQQVDPATGAYSNSMYWITFAGIAPANDPRFVVAIMLDNPQRGTQPGGSGGQSAAPVFHDIASWLLDRENIPPSPEAPPLVLEAQ